MEGKILQELSCIGFAKVTDYLAVEDNALVVRSTDGLTQEQAAAIAAIERSPSGVKVKFYDKLKALELLGRQIGMFEGKAAVPKSENNLLQAIVEATKGEVDISDLPELQ